MRCTPSGRARNRRTLLISSSSKMLPTENSIHALTYCVLSYYGYNGIRMTHLMIKIYKCDSKNQWSIR